MFPLCVETSIAGTRMQKRVFFPCCAARHLSSYNDASNDEYGWKKEEHLSEEDESDFAEDFEILESEGREGEGRKNLSAEVYEAQTKLNSILKRKRLNQLLAVRRDIINLTSVLMYGQQVPMKHHFEMGIRATVVNRLTDHALSFLKLAKENNVELSMKTFKGCFEVLGRQRDFESAAKFKEFFDEQFPPEIIKSTPYLTKLYSQVCTLQVDLFKRDNDPSRFFSVLQGMQQCDLEVPFTMYQECLRNLAGNNANHLGKEVYEQMKLSSQSCYPSRLCFFVTTLLFRKYIN